MSHTKTTSYTLDLAEKAQQHPSAKKGKKKTEAKKSGDRVSAKTLLIRLNTKSNQKMKRRNSYGAEPSDAKKGRKSPDFVVAKATGTLCSDQIVLIVEVKTARASIGAARIQLDNYLRSASQKNTSSPFYGLLVRHSSFDLYKVTAGEPHLEKPNRSMTRSFYSDLCEIFQNVNNVKKK